MPVGRGRAGPAELRRGAPAQPGRDDLAELHRSVSRAVHRLTEEKERAPCLADGEKAGVVKMWDSRRLVVLDVLMACWGLGTWLGVNGLFVQLPLLVQRLPEGWALGSAMAVAVQCANVSLVAYAALRRLRPAGSDAHYIYGLLTVGTLALFLNAFLYEKTVLVASQQRSVAFLALTVLAALVGCTSSVLFYPYLRHYRDVYLATYLAGEGLSGFVPSVVALVQGVGGESECRPNANGTLVPVYPPPLFDSTVFLVAMTALSALSLCSFVAIHNSARFASERVVPAAAAKDEEATAEQVSLTSARWATVLALMTLLNALSNGVLPAVQSYSCMPYGATAYHLAACVGALAAPAACLAGVWLRPLPARALAVCLLAVLPPLCYILTTAALSPAPPLQHRAGGVALVVVSWVCVTGVLSYARMWVYGWARRGGAKGMRACGAATQLGSALGSLLLYVLVNVLRVFVQRDACKPMHL